MLRRVCFHGKIRRIMFGNAWSISIALTSRTHVRLLSNILQVNGEEGSRQNSLNANVEVLIV